MNEEERRNNKYTDNDLFADRPSAAAEERRKNRAALLERKRRAADPGRQRARSHKRLRYAAWAVFILFFVGAGLNAGLKLYTLNSEKALVKARLDATKDQQARLEQQLELVETDEYIENEARSNLHMKYPNETMYVVEGDETTGAGIQAPDGGAKPND